jgi:hypothetical protein
MRVLDQLRSDIFQIIHAIGKGGIPFKIPGTLTTSAMVEPQVGHPLFCAVPGKSNLLLGLTVT